MHALKKFVATVGIVGGLTAAGLAIAPAASANPGPGNSFACAPGQQGNPAPGFKPAACGHR